MCWCEQCTWVSALNENKSEPEGQTHITSVYWWMKWFAQEPGKGQMGENMTQRLEEETHNPPWEMCGPVSRVEETLSTVVVSFYYQLNMIWNHLGGLLRTFIRGHINYLNWQRKAYPEGSAICWARDGLQKMAWGFHINALDPSNFSWSFANPSMEAQTHFTLIKSVSVFAMKLFLMANLALLNLHKMLWKCDSFILFLDKKAEHCQVKRRSKRSVSGKGDLPKWICLTLVSTITVFSLSHWVLVTFLVNMTKYPTEAT